jgi:hypothetical protein
MKTIDAQKALRLLQDEKTPWWVKSNIKDLLCLTPQGAAELFGLLDSIFRTE